MVLSLKNKNIKMLTLSLILALVICLSISIYYYYPTTIEGIVDHKTVVGVKDGVAKTILLIMPDGTVIIKDENVKQHVMGANITSLEKIKSILHMYYAKVYCTVSVRTLTGDLLNNLAPGETLAYIVSEEHFDMLKIGANVKFEITRINPLKISKIVEIEL